jgi:hypothetical protein
VLHGLAGLPFRQDVGGRQQQIQGGRRRELGRLAKAAVHGIGVLQQLHRRLRCALRAGGRVRGAFGTPRQRRDDSSGVLVDLVAPRAIRVRYADEDVAEGGHSVARLRRKVGAAIEGPAVGRAEGREGPSAVTREAGHRVHVDLIDVRAFLAIDLDVHEQLVHERRRLGVLEGFVGHHVAPVAGAVPDGDEQRPVLPARSFQGLRPPRIPIHGVVHVLAQVGAGLAGQSVAGPLARRIRHAPSDPSTCQPTRFPALGGGPRRAPSARLLRTSRARIAP